jgi:hypothetical protein
VSALGIFVISNFYYRIEMDLYFTTIVFFNISFFTFVLIEMYKYTRLDQQSVILKVLLLSGAFNIVLSTILTPVFNMPGAFLSNTICMISTFILFKYHAFRTRN